MNTTVGVRRVLKRLIVTVSQLRHPVNAASLFLNLTPSTYYRLGWSIKHVTASLSNRTSNTRFTAWVIWTLSDYHQLVHKTYRLRCWDTIAMHQVIRTALHVLRMKCIASNALYGSFGRFETRNDTTWLGLSGFVRIASVCRTRHQAQCYACCTTSAIWRCWGTLDIISQRDWLLVAKLKMVSGSLWLTWPVLSQR